MTLRSQKISPGEVSVTGDSDSAKLVGGITASTAPVVRVVTRALAELHRFIVHVSYVCGILCQIYQ
jgi:hypothetical protein